MAYTGHTWSVNEAITRNNMNHIEEGIASVHNTTDNNTRNITTISDSIGDGFSSSNKISTKISNLEGIIRSIDGNMSAVTDTITEVRQSHSSARKESVTSTNTKSYLTLAYHLNDLDEAANIIDEAIQRGSLALQFTNLNNGLERIETNLNRVDRTAQTAWDSIDNSINETGHTFETLLKRFQSIDAAINNITSVTIPAAVIEKIGNLSTYNTAVEYFEGRLGMPTGSTYTAASYTDSRIGDLSGQANVQGYVNMMTAGSHTYTDAQITANNTAIGASEIAGAHRQDVMNDTLDNRFDDIESAISHAASGNDAGGLTERLGTLENAVNHTVTGLAATKNALDALTQTVNNLDVGGATIIIPENRITYNQETGLPTIYIDSTKSVIDNTISESYDYLLEKDNKYYYWKYINNSWKLISGGGSSESGSSGGGTSSAVIISELPTAANANENIDYYVGNNNDGYIHYRYIPSEIDGEDGTFITILPKKLTDNIDNLLNHATVSTVTTTTSYSEEEAWPTGATITGGPAVYNISDTNHTNNLLDDFTAVRNARVNAVYDGEVLQSQTLQVLDTKGHLMEYPIVGGGSGGSAYSIRFLSTMNSNIFTVPQDSTYRTVITAKPIVKQGNDILSGVSFSGEILYRLNSESETTWHKSNIVLPIIQNNTEFSVDVSSILASNTTTKVRIALTINTGDGEPVERFVDYTITKTQISISSTFNPATILTSANLVVHYTCMGVGLEKQVHFKIDGVEVFNQPIIVNTHNEESQTSIPLLGLTNGSHTLQIYFETTGGVTSNKLNYYIMYSTDASSNTPIVGLNAVDDDIIYGEELAINYTAYTPGKEKTEKVEIQLYTKDEHDQWVLYNDNTDVYTDVPVELSSWKTVMYPMPITPAAGNPEEPVEVQVKIKAYNTVITLDANEEPVTTVYTAEKTTNAIINRFTNPNNYDFNEVAPNNLLFSYSAYGKSNNSADRANYEYTYVANDALATPLTFHGTFTNFNWATNGYMDDGSLLINGEAKYSIDVPIFQSSYNGTTIESSTANDITEFGRTIEIDYEVRSATDLNATIIQYKEDDVEGEPKKPGIVITPSYCYLTNKTTPAEIDEKDGFILNESSIAAAYLQTNTRIHLVFVIEPWSNTKAYDKTYHQSVNIYINGEFANSCPYTRDSDGRIIDDFTSNGILTLGSDSCILKVYNIKMYNRGLTRSQVLQLYKLSPNLLYDRLARFESNDIFENGVVSYEKAKRRYNCLLLKGPDPTAQDTLDYPTISPFKGSPSPAKRKKKASATDYDGKTESGLVFTKPSSDPTKNGFVEEFNLCDKVPVGAPAYLGQAGAYCSSNNVQGTSSQKYPLHNLKVYLAKWQAEKTTTTEVELEQGEDTTGLEIVEHDGVQYKVVTETTPAQIKKVKYSLKGYNDDGTPKGTEESTLCWKADYMSTDHANTYNANIADTLFTNEAAEGWNPKWDEKHLQNTVYGIRCLLFQQQGDNATPVFVGDGCLNNDKGNTKTYGLEDDSDDGNNTLHQKWEFTNNTSPLDVFKSDNLFGINEADSKRQIFAKGAFECNYPDEGDLKDEGLEPNYNHLQLLLTWVNKRACYLDYSVYDENTSQTTNYTVSDIAGSGGTYNGVTYSTERELKKAIFKNEFEDHFIKSHVLTYYLFSEYVALCDNRAKNMFMRSEDIRSEVIYNTSGQKILDGNEYPDDDLTGTRWSAYVNASTGVTNPSVINWNTSGENHSTFARWAPVLYDLDSCFGVENVGLITIKYNADWQYQYNNKEAFSGFDSVFWLMVEDTYANELRALATQLYNNELNFTNFYRQQIAGNLSATCPALTNEDMILKYQQPWNEGFINYAKDPDPVTGEYPKETPEYKYIQRGTRTTQKTTFMRQRSMLLSSKYVSNEFTNNMISFRAGKLVTGNDTLLTLVANQDLYPAIMFGDSNTLVRPSYIIQNNADVAIDGTSDIVPAGTYCKITTSQIGNSDTVKIVGASVLNDIGDLSKYHPYELKVSSGSNLKRLVIGSDANGYVNDSTQSIEGLSDCALLEEINVRNLTKMSSLNLGGNGLIKKVYAKGSYITTISVPNGGVLEEIEYGARTTNITLLNQSFFTTFSFENLNPSEPNTYPNLTKLWVENTPNVPVVDIIKARLGNLVDGLRLVGINLSLGNDTTLLEMLTTDELIQGKRINSNGSLDTTNHPYISGTITVNSLRSSIYNKLQELYPDLTVTAGVIETEHPIIYKNVDANGNETTLITLYRINGEQIPDPILDTDSITGKYYIQSAPANQIGFDGIQYVPLRAADAQYQYKFGTYETSGVNIGKYKRYTGWINKDTNESPTSSTTINDEIILLAQYPTTVIQTYTVTWYDDENNILSQVDNVEYGSDASVLSPPGKYNVNSPLVTKKLAHGKYKVFRGWDRPVGIVTGNIDVHSLWYESNGNFANMTDINDLNPADLYAITRLDATSRDRLLSGHLGTDLKYITLGKDFDYDPEYVTTYDLIPEGYDSLFFDGNNENIRIFDGTSNDAIYPLIDLSQDFTFAIDFKFLMDDTLWASNTSEYVLASCYRDRNGSYNGFKITLTKNTPPEIRVTWGDSLFTTIDYCKFGTEDDGQNYYNTYRNMIVLRHSGMEPQKLYVYVHSLSNRTLPEYYSTGSIIGPNMTGSSSIAVETPLILGGNYTYSAAQNKYVIESSGSRMPAKGVIYYAKYWDKDLGSNNCSELAAWPHETVGYKISGYYDGKPQTDASSKLILGSSDTNTINFTPAQIVGDRYYNFALTNDSAFSDSNSTLINGWHNSIIRHFVNNHLYNGFPTAYQSLIEAIKINSRPQEASNASGSATLTPANNIPSIDDKIYLPCYAEVYPNLQQASPYRIEAIHPWSWLDQSNINNVYTLDGTGNLIEETNFSASDLNYLRFQFFQKPITPTTRIFHISYQQTSETPYGKTFYLNNRPITIQPGDIWYNGTMAYMYISASDVERGIRVDKTKNGGTGGWAQAITWSLRTYDYGWIRRQNAGFMKVLKNGTVSDGGDTSEAKRGLIPQFSI